MRYRRQFSGRALVRRLHLVVAGGLLLGAAGPASIPAVGRAAANLAVPSVNDPPTGPRGGHTIRVAQNGAPQNGAPQNGIPQNGTPQNGGARNAAPGNGGPPNGADAQPGLASDANGRLVASVEGHPIYLSDLGQAAQGLSPEYRSRSFESIYPVLLDRMVDHEALVMLARRRGLEENPSVKQQIAEETERVLEAAVLGVDVVPKVTEDAIKARYDQLYANHPPTEQVHARHILVATEIEADKLIADLKNGGDFAALAKQYSKDPDGQTGGELGFFSRDQVGPGFAAVAFSLQPGQLADQPVQNEYGWHVVQVEDRRTVPPPSFADAHDAIRNDLLAAAVRQEVALARSQVTIHEWNLDGSPIDPGMPPGSVTARPK